MATSTSEPGAESSGKIRSKISQGDIPAISLEKTLRIPRAIAENYGSAATRPLNVALALDVSPSTGPFRTACGAAVGYGLTSGGPNAPEISLLPLGKRVVTPTEEGDDELALREAAMKPTIAQKFYSKYDGNPLPPKQIAQNVLASMDVPADRTGDVFDLLIENATFVGFIKKIKDKIYLDLGAHTGGRDGIKRLLTDSKAEGELFDEEESLDDLGKNGISAPPINPPIPNKNAIFIGHGINRKPMEQLVKILNEYGIPYKQALEEANRARPISQKVAEVMRECGAAILVFTADKEYFDKEGNPIWRPSENVSHELGAASVLYGSRIIIFKEKGIELPSNFSGVGYIEFEQDKLGDKASELFRELVSMKILTISIG